MATELKLPEVGEGIDAGTVVGILVAVGDTVSVDQPLLELETDKAVVEMPCPVSGTVASITVSEGDEIPIGHVVMTVEEGAVEAAPAKGDASEASPAEEPAEKAAEPAPEASSEPAPTPAPAASVSSAPLRASDAPLPAAPSVRRLARELGVDLHAVQGSGILGRISAEDVRTFAQGGTPRGAAAGTTAAPQPLPDFAQWGETERAPMSGIRKATVRSMTNAWTTVPMVTHFDKADATRFDALRKRFKGAAEARGAKLTPTAILVGIVAAALRKFPDFNASIDVANNEIVYKKYVNVGVAVDTPNGLLVPVIKNADQKSIIDLAVELGELAQKARDRKLTPDEMQGGNFSVSNLGGIGGTGFTPIVNPPDVAILGVSRGQVEPIWDAESETFVPRSTMPLSVSYDHRLIDGAAAARFLRWVCEAVEEPFLINLDT